MNISVAIPCYEMQGVGHIFLNHSLTVLEQQTFRDFEVVVSDHSIDNKVKEVCESNKVLDIKYFRNEFSRGSSSANANNCIKNSNGKIIKILCQDDFLFSENSLDMTFESFSVETKWMVSAYAHTEDGIHIRDYHSPEISSNICLINKIGTHSCLSILNEDPLLFDENLIWYMDSDYYERAYRKFGMPNTLLNPTVVQRLWRGQVTNTLINNKVIQKERNYLNEKYGFGSIPS